MNSKNCIFTFDYKNLLELGFIKLILYFLAFYYIFKFLSRLYLAYVLNRFKNNTYRYNKTDNKNNQEGEVSIDKMPKEKFKKNDLGDYIDYEEID